MHAVTRDEALSGEIKRESAQMNSLYIRAYDVRCAKRPTCKNMGHSKTSDDGQFHKSKQAGHGHDGDSCC